MGLLIAFAALVFLAATLRIVMVTPPRRLAAFLRQAGPVALIAGGAILTLLGRGAIGIPVFGLGLAGLRRARTRQPVETDGGPDVSTVRSLWLDMTLDHDTGDLDGSVLRGERAGRRLSDLDEAALMALRDDVSGDPDSLRLLEAYLDRRVAGWRADAKAQARDGLGGAPGSGPMTEQEAHEILGLQPGASVAEVREAHRRLMKRVHPDHGGTDFLAARINEAKAFLIERHR